MWPPTAFVPLVEHFGSYNPNTEIEPGDSIGRIADLAGHGPEEWAVFHDPPGCRPGTPPLKCEVTPGARNPVPRIRAFNLPDGAELAIGGVGFAWADRQVIDRYRLELGTEDTFADPLLDIELAGPAVRLNLSEIGQYVYRVSRCVGPMCSPPSEPRAFTTYQSACSCNLLKHVATDAGVGVCPLPPTSQFHVIRSVLPTLQRKDTCMVCGKCKQASGAVSIRPELPGLETIDVSNAVATSTRPWVGMMRSCRPRNTRCRRAVRYRGHGSGYCVPASVSMIASAYGACLSQDRVAYFLNSLEDASAETFYPGGDLSHEEVAAFFCDWPSDFESNECEQALAWMLGWRGPGAPYSPTPQPDDLLVVYDPPAPIPTSADLNKVRTFLESGRPIMAAVGNHVHVVAGICTDNNLVGEVLIYDPLDGPKVIPFKYWHMQVDRAWAAASTLGALGGRVTSANARSDDLEIWLDTDRDKIFDFDEIRRFFTNPMSPIPSTYDLQDILNAPTVREWSPPDSTPFDTPP